VNSGGLFTPALDWPSDRLPCEYSDGDKQLQIAQLLPRLEELQRQRRVFATSGLGHICDYLKKTHTSVVPAPDNLSVIQILQFAPDSGSIDARILGWPE